MRKQFWLFVVILIAFLGCQKEKMMQMDPIVNNPFLTILDSNFDNSTCSIIYSGKITGFIQSDVPEEYGFVYSVVNTKPTVEDQKIVESDPFENSLSFSEEIVDYQYGVPIYMRVYAIHDGEVFYSIRTDEFKVDIRFNEGLNENPVLESCGTSDVTMVFEYNGCLPKGYEYGVQYLDQKGIIGFNSFFVEKGSTDGNTAIRIESELIAEAEGRNAYRIFFNSPDGTGGNGSVIRLIPEVGEQPVVSAMKDFPGEPRGEATSFVFNGKGYVCGGYTEGRMTNLADLWEYTPETDTWIKKADVPGGGKAFMTAFTTQNYAYVGLGGAEIESDISSSNRFYRYDPNTDIWSEISPFPAAGIAALGFSIEGKGYVGGLLQDGSEYDNRFFTYNEQLDEWVEIASFPGIFPNGRGSAISVNGLGYVLTTDPSTHKYTSYDPDSDEWTISEFEIKYDGNDGLTFEKNGKIFQLTGRNSPVILEVNVTAEEFIPYCSDPLLSRSEASGFKIADAFYIVSGVEENRNTTLALNPLRSVVKVEVPD